MGWYGIQSKAAIPDGFWQRMAGAWGRVQAGGRGNDSKRDRAPRRQLLPWWALVQVLYQHSYGITKLLWYGMVIRTNSFQKYVEHYYAFIFHQLGPSILFTSFRQSAWIATDSLVCLLVQQPFFNSHQNIKWKVNCSGANIQIFLWTDSDSRKW